MTGAVAALLDARVPARIALMRLMLAGADCDHLSDAIEHLHQDRLDDGAQSRLRELRLLLAHARPGLGRVRRMVAEGAAHRAGMDLASTRAMFDRLVRISPEASVAAYSLGDARLLGEATEEVLRWMDGQHLLRAGDVVLDLGCGIGRFCVALAPRVRLVIGTELSEGMAKVARKRCAGFPNAWILRGSGRDLAAFADRCFDLVLAADVFPYLVQAGMPLAARHIAEAARVLRPGGRLAILNFSYRCPTADRGDLMRLAREAGLAIESVAEQPFALWDATAFVLRRPEEESGACAAW